MRCPKCGNNLSDSDTVCDFCGYVVEREHKNDTSNNDFFFQNKREKVKEEPVEKPKSSPFVKLIFFVAILACLIYVMLVASRWLNNKDNQGSSGNSSQTINTNNDSNNNNNNSSNNNNNGNSGDKTENNTETVIDHSGYRYIIPAYYNVYKNTDAYVELINNNDKVNIIMYKLLEMDYSLIKAAPESYTTSLQEKNMTIIKNLEKFYNNRRYYVIYCKSGNNNYYQIFTSFYGKTLSFGITDYGGNVEDDLFDVIDMIIADATVIS